MFSENYGALGCTDVEKYKLKEIALSDVGYYVDKQRRYLLTYLEKYLSFPNIDKQMEIIVFSYLGFKGGAEFISFESVHKNSSFMSNLFKQSIFLNQKEIGITHTTFEEFYNHIKSL